jgi:hypothetical protein
MQAVRQRRTTEDDSRGMPAPNRAIARPAGVRTALTLAALLGVAALVLATWMTVIEITVGTTSRLANLDTSLSGWDRHGPALLVVGAFAFVMLLGTLRGARPAMVAVGVCGVAALVVALGFDVPHLDDTGQVGELYSDASAGPGVGFWLELVGGVLLVGAGVGLLLVDRKPYQRPLEAGVSGGTGESRAASSRG